MVNGTKTENDGQSNTEQELTWDALVAEMEKGASSDLDTIMSGKEQEPEPEANKPTKEPVVESTPSEDDTSDDADSRTENKYNATQEAAAAASPDKTDADRIAELERELHKTRSDAGRVPYIQRRIQELERELRAKSARSPASAETKTVDATDTEIPATLKKKYDQIRETDADLADTLEETFRMQSALSRQAQDEAVTSLTQADQEREDREFFLTEKSKLVSLVPQADQVFALPEWKQWKESLTPGRKAIASSGYADEMAQAIYAFAADYQAARGQPLFQQPTQAALPVQQGKSVVAENDAVKQERDRKLGQSAEAKTAAAKASEEFDSDKAFHDMYEKLRKEQGR